MWNIPLQQIQIEIYCDQSYHVGIEGKVIPVGYSGCTCRCESRRRLWFYLVLMRRHESINAGFTQEETSEAHFSVRDFTHKENCKMNPNQYVSSRKKSCEWRGGFMTNR